MKTLTKLGLLAIVLLALAACQPPVVPAEVPPQAELPQDVASEASADLAGTEWILSSLDGSLPLADITVTLVFGADGTVSGTDGCNRFSTTYTQDGNNLSINQPAASTMMACPEPVMSQATAYMAALAETTSFIATERQLILRAGDEIVATFVADSQELAGTAWDVLSYNNGRDAVVSLLPGTEITANFGENGEVAGNAGCNEYFADFTVDGNAIEIGMPGTTFRFCPEPPGVLDQEFEYLVALQSAATYSIQAGLLEMRTAGDQIAVVMTRKAILDLPAPAPEPATPTGRVTGAQSLNVRSGPGTNFPVIGVARAGDEGEIVGRSEDGRWWAVAVPSAPGGIGWVSADFVLATNAEDVPVIAAPPPPPPTATPLPAPPTPTRLPATPTPPPAATATPGPQISFWADRTSIQQGQCATLNWSVQNVQAVWVYPRGESYSNFPRAGQGSEVVCPVTTTTYEMRVLQRDGTTVFREVTISVAAPAPTATPVPPPPTATPAPAPDPLAGSRWEVVNYNDGNGIVTLLPGTRITMEFGTDGQVRGNSGCNTYFASYQASGTSISIGQPAGTTLFCGEPEGVMDQEARFLFALPTVATLRLDGNLLELSSGAGQIVVVANRAP